MAEVETKKVTKTEKKTRDVMHKLGLSPVKDIFRVTLKQKEGLLMVVAEPDVFASPSGEIYVVFGEQSFDDLNQRAQAAARQTVTKPVEAPVAKPTTTTTTTTADDEEIVAEVVADSIDYQGVDKADVELVCKETGKDKQTVIEALKKNSDIVSVVLELSSN